MTQDDVMRLSGRELDAAVAELVFGLRVVECDPVDGRYGPYTVREGHWTRVNGETYPLLDLLPEYSTDIAAAWEVVDRLRDLNWHVVVKTKGYMLWHCVLEADFPPYMEGAIAPTAPEAICRAALLSALKRSEAKR